MKAVYIAKQLTIVATLGLAFSAHAQLLGGRGPVGGMIGGMGNLGSVTQMTGRGSMVGGADSAVETTRSAKLHKSASANGEANGSGSASLLGSVSNAAPAAPALTSTSGAAPSAPASTTSGAAAATTAPAAAQGKGIGGLVNGGNANTAGGAAGNADASGGGNATLGLDTRGGAGAVGSVDQNASNIAQPARQGVRTQADTTRTFAQASGANAKSTAGQMNATGHAQQIAGAARSGAVQSQPKASGSAQGSGSGSGSGSVSGGGSAAKGE